MRITTITGFTIAILFLGFVVYVYGFSVNISPQTNALVNRVINEELPELVKGKTGFAKSGDIDIWYEMIIPRTASRGTIVLNMGFANDALAWPEFFIQPLLDAGYHVIRYDQRGTGISDWMDGWEEAKPYSLEDMAEDVVAVLDTLHIEKAHILGVSMGGMVAQTFAIRHPERTLSLTSIMSSGHIMDEELPGMPETTLMKLLAINLRYGMVRSELNLVKMHIGLRQVLNGSELQETGVVAIVQQVLYNLRERNGFNPNAHTQHIAAIGATGSRYEGLPCISVPVLVVHGKADPLIPFEHGKKCAELIPHAETLWIEEMGHNISEKKLPVLMPSLLAHLSKVSAI